MNDELSALKQILDDSDQMIIVCDMETCDMLYANTRLLKASAHAGEPYLGRKCYKYVMESDEICSYCPLRNKEGNLEVVKNVEDFTGVYSIKTKIIDWNGRKAFVEYASDITEMHLLERR